MTPLTERKYTVAGVNKVLNGIGAVATTTVSKYTCTVVGTGVGVVVLRVAIDAVVVELPIVVAVCVVVVIRAAVVVGLGLAVGATRLVGVAEGVAEREKIQPLL
jgi:hypothetical protein